METKSQPRLLSLDVFRGATIIMMIIVNNPGSDDHVYAQAHHAAWNGWTIADMVFPFFLFIMGMAMEFSLARRLSQGSSGSSSRTIHVHIVRRTLILFALGLLVNTFPGFDIPGIRIPGVLQRIAVCYAVVSLLVLHTGTQVQWSVALGCLVGYSAILLLVPVPGFGAGHLEPVGNVVGWVDSTLLRGHTWVWAPAPGFDPEGIVSTIPAFATTLAGVFAGRWFRRQTSAVASAVWMFVAGYVLVLAGVVFDIVIPINKNLWTSSYVLFMAGWALVVFAMCYWFIDVRGKTRWAMPLLVVGMNPIAIYVLSELVGSLLWSIPATLPDGTVGTVHDELYARYFLFVGSLEFGSLLFSVLFLAPFVLLAWYMYGKGIIIKL